MWNGASFAPVLQLYERLPGLANKRGLTVVDADWTFDSQNGRFGLRLKLKNASSVPITVTNVSDIKTPLGILQTVIPAAVGDHAEPELGPPCYHLPVGIVLAPGHTADLNQVYTPSSRNSLGKITIAVGFITHGTRTESRRILLQHSLR